MSPQLSCGNTCQTWMWYTTCNMCFDYSYWKINRMKESSLVVPKPVPLIHEMTSASNPHRRHVNSGWMKAKFYCALFNPFSITMIALLRIPSWLNWFSSKSIAQWFMGAMGSYQKTTAWSKVELFLHMVDYFHIIWPPRGQYMRCF